MSELWQSVETLMGGLSIGSPWVLWGLVSLPLLIVLTFRSRYPLGRRRQAMVLLTRMVVAALLVLAMADLRWARPSAELSIATVIDSSASIATADRERIARDLSALSQAHGDVTWVGVSGETDRGAAANAEEGPPLSTADQVSAALASMPTDRVRRLLVATDGRDPGVGLASVMATAHRSGVEVSVLPLGDNPPVDLLSVTGLSIPTLGRAGQSLDVSVLLHASSETDVALNLLVDGVAIAEASINSRATLGHSAHHIHLTLPEEEGVHEVVVQAIASGDRLLSNNRWRSLIRISPKPRVRILYDPRNGPPMLATVLQEGGFSVEPTPLTQAPTSLDAWQPYSLAIVDEANPTGLSERQQQALHDWVHEEGGGLLTVTGAHPLRRSPRLFRQLEPVTVPPAIPEPRPLELVLVIDRSSSMSGRNIVQARNAGVAAVQALRRDARVGVVAFSGRADRIMAPAGMDQASNVTAFIRGINASGGTNIASAIDAANRVMSHDPRYIHHVILLSDGVSASAPALASAQALAGRGVSITAISIGNRNELMAEIARIGRGRYHVTHSAGSLPSLFIREAQYRQPPAHRRVTFVPRVSAPLSMLDGISFEGAPPLTGHALAGLRRGATAALTTAEGRPLFAHWHRGLGQVATFTSATSGAWSDRFRTWSEYRQLWVSIAEGLLRSRPVQPPTLHLNPHPSTEGVQILSVLAPTLSSDPSPIVRVFRRADLAEALTLRLRGPGVWQAELSEEEGMLVDARMPADDRVGTAIRFDRPYDRELARFGSDRSGLERLAQSGGGALLGALDSIVEVPEPELMMRSLRTWLLALAIAFYLFGLLLLRLPDHSLGATYSRKTKMSRPRPPAQKRRRWRNLDDARRREGHRPSRPVDDTEEAA